MQLEKAINKQTEENKKKLEEELSGHTKQVNSLQQKLSASELRIRTLDS